VPAGGSTVVGGESQTDWFSTVNHLARVTPWLHAPARLYAEYGIAVFAALLLVAWLLARRSGDLARVGASLWAPIGALIAIGVNQFLVGAVGEPRPYTVLPDALVLVTRSADHSFPSDHAVMAGAVAAGVLLAHRRLGLVAVALAVLMAAVRVYVGAHFPLDVLAGLAVGALIAAVSYAAVQPLLSRVVTALSQTRVQPLLTARAENAGDSGSAVPPDPGPATSTAPAA
jgi:membrane-associated phospholipid phosphatase